MRAEKAAPVVLVALLVLAAWTGWLVRGTMAAPERERCALIR